MQGPRAMSVEDISNLKTRKKKQQKNMVPSVQMKGETKGVKDVLHPSGKTQKTPKRSLKNDVPSTFPQTDRATPDPLPDSGSNDEYRALRRKYLLLEEESFSLDKDLGEAEAEIKTLEDEKFALLDQLVVLEGLIDPSELHSKRGL